MNKYYTPSGKFSSATFLYLFGILFLALPLLGLIYAYAIWYIPFIYINMFIAVGFGLAMAFLINLMIEKGKLRNPKIAFLLAILVGFVGLYFHWAVWVDLVLNISDSIGDERLGISISNIEFLQVYELALNPAYLFSLIKEINEYGTWGIRATTVSGMVLAAFWLVETAIILYFTLNTAYEKAGLPFEESSETWYKETVLLPKNFIEDANDLIYKIENGNEKAFENLQIAENAATANHSVFVLYSSENEGNYLTIRNVTATMNKKNEIEFDDKIVVRNIYINNLLVGKLIN